jgi:pimeloyl-ACP methyl ester carboxylesterase
MRMIHGHDDQLFPIANTEYLLNNVPGSDAVIIPNSGHMLFIEQAENFHQALYEFLQKYA